MDVLSLSRTGSTLALSVLLMISFCLAGNAYATGSTAGGKVVFGGVVTKPATPDQIQTYPQEVISFGGQAVLPIDRLVAGSGNVSVYNTNGEKVSGSSTILVSNGTKPMPVQLIDLDNTRNQVFVVCVDGSKNCLRFRVRRW